MPQTKQIKPYASGASSKEFDPRDPRFVYVALASDKAHIVFKLDSGALYELPIKTLEAAEDYDGTVAEYADTIDDGTAAIVQFTSGAQIDFPVDFVLHHCEPNYSHFRVKIGKPSGIGKRVREFRHAKKLTLTQVSQKTGIAEPNLSRLEHGKHMPSLGTLQLIAKALGVPASALISKV